MGYFTVSHTESAKSGVQLTPSEHPGVAALNPPPWLVAAQLENAALSCDAETSKFESRLLPPPAKCKFESSALGASVENGNISTWQGCREVQTKLCPQTA